MARLSNPSIYGVEHVQARIDGPWGHYHTLTLILTGEGDPECVVLEIFFSAEILDKMQLLAASINDTFGEQP